MERPRAVVRGPVLDSADPLGLARFYSALLGWPIRDEAGPRPGAPEGDGWAILVAPDGALKLECQFDPNFVAPIWPSASGQPLAMAHLDVAVDDLARAEAWALECGATLAATQPQKGVRVLLDPAGHPFCLFEHAIATRPRQTVIPRAVVNVLDRAVTFLRAVFGVDAEVHPSRPVEVRLGDSVVLVSEAGARAAFPAFLYVYVDDADATYRRAMDAGATSVEPPTDTEYGDRRAMFRDPSGNVFQVAHRP